MITATVTHDGRVNILHAEKGMTVLEILRSGGVFIDAPCSGRGHCGKCAVKASGLLSPPQKAEIELLPPALLEHGCRLACLAVATGDISVTVPDTQAVKIETGGAAQNCVFAPSVTVDASGSHFKVDFRGAEIDSLGDAAPVLGMALDIGTTTLAARFFDLISGKNLGTETALNPQRKFGADVISRIATCSDAENGTEKLCSAVRGAVSQMTEKFCMRCGAAADNIYHCIIAGNTVMQHIAAGISPAGMGRSPFKPSTLFGCETSAESFGIGLNHSTRVYFSPCVSAFVGGDITAGLLACGFDTLQKPTLFVDIGTNGEMALLCHNDILCCSTAAGPAFEGAHIVCGTGSVAGAISRVAAGSDGVTYETIGGAKAAGICGSGLIDAVAALMDLGLLDETGALDTEFESSERGAYFPIGKSDIYITQKDVREIQLAKSAVASGVESLLCRAGLKAADISRVFVAGGFGACINIKNACRIGLLPREFLPLATPVYNTSLAGASMLLLDRHSFDRIDNITRRCRIVELAGNTFFEKRFVENMLFDR